MVRHEEPGRGLSIPHGPPAPAGGRRVPDRERQLEAVFAQAMIGIMQVDLAGRQMMANARFCEILGRSPDDLRGLTFEDYTHPDDLVWNKPLYEEQLRQGAPFQIEKRYLRPDGSALWCAVQVSFVRDAGGRPESCIVIAEDISARRSAEQELLGSQLALKESEQLNRSIVEATTDCVCLLERSGKIAFVNAAGVDAMGFDALADLLDRSWLRLWPVELHETVLRALGRALAGGIARFSEVCRSRRGDYKWWDVVVSPVRGPDGRAIRLVTIARDVTQQKAIEENVRWAATHDALTGLPNRTLFQERLGAALLAAEGAGSTVGLLHLDVDHFKEVNDTFGHDAGDELLKTFAARLASAMRAGDTVARLGGDEFAIVVPGLRTAKDIETVVESILVRMREPFVYSERIVDCRASIGASIYPRDADSPAALLKSADIALYMAKAAGRGGLMVFRPEMRADAQRRSSMIAVARDALRDDRVAPFYQPKIDLKTHALAGFESLLRWRTTKGGIQAPAMIAAAFEDVELATAISERMVRLSIADMRRWLDQGLSFGHVAVNAGASEFRQDDFAERVLEELHRAGVPPSCLELEVTETVFLGRGAEYVERALKLLSAEGVSIALDDFGTGYASLRHLKQFPVDVIKIDQNFVRDLHRPDDAAIIQAVVKLGRALGIKTVAEGIETAAQEDYLFKAGCDLGQGHLYSRAVGGLRVPRLIREWRCGDARRNAA